MNIQEYQKQAILFIVLDFAIAVSFPVAMMLFLNGNFNQEVNPAITNGVLSATAIVFAFVIFELRDIKITIYEKFRLSLPLLFWMMATLLSILFGAILGKMTLGVVMVATSNCLFNIFYIFPIMLLKSKNNL
jgi:hypothetical protein